MRWQEPSVITQGDTISFTKKLGRYLASQGWSLLYALRGNGQDITFISVADVDNHVVTVDKATTEGWLPAEYQLEGFAVSSTQRFQIYLGAFTVLPDLATAAPDVDVQTHAQKMLQKLEAQLLKVADNILLETDVEQTKVLRERRMELLKFRQSYLQERRGELAAEAARNKRPTGRKIKTVFSITPPGAVGIHQFGAGNSVFNCDIG